MALQFERTYVGTINENLRVSMQLRRNGSQLTGTYAYATGNGKLDLRGIVAADQTFEMTESNGSGATTGRFQGKINADKTLVGTWSDPVGARKLSFQASEAVSAAPSAGGSTAPTALLPPRTMDGKPLVTHETLHTPYSLKPPEQGGTPVEARTCGQLESLLRRNYKAQIGSDWDIVRSHQLDCRARELARAATASKDSFLREIDFGSDLASVLPAALAIPISNEMVEMQKQFVAQGRSWRDFEPTIRFQGFREAVAYYTTSVRSSITVTPKAFGDFNQDGFEDLLVESYERPEGAQLSWEKMLILTKTTPNGPISAYRTIEAQSFRSW